MKHELHSYELSNHSHCTDLNHNLHSCCLFSLTDEPHVATCLKTSFYKHCTEILFLDDFSNACYNQFLYRMFFHKIDNYFSVMHLGQWTSDCACSDLPGLGRISGSVHMKT